MRLNLIKIATLKEDNTGTTVSGYIVVSGTKSDHKLQFDAQVFTTSLASPALPTGNNSIRLRNAETVYQLLSFQFGQGTEVSLEQQSVLREAVFEYIIEVHEQLIGTMTKKVG